MHTTINKHVPKPWEHVINNDGKAWTTDMPKCERGELTKKKYIALIPDERLDHCSFECFGYHRAWADTIDELIDDIRSFNVPYYSEDAFLNSLRNKDTEDTRNDRQIELHFDSRGTRITRGELTINNMSAYTSL